MSPSLYNLSRSKEKMNHRNSWQWSVSKVWVRSMRSYSTRRPPMARSGRGRAGGGRGCRRARGPGQGGWSRGDTGEAGAESEARPRSAQVTGGRRGEAAHRDLRMRCCHELFEQLKYSIIFKNRIYSVFIIQTFFKNRKYSLIGLF